MANGWVLCECDCAGSNVGSYPAFEGGIYNAKGCGSQNCDDPKCKKQASGKNPVPLQGPTRRG